MARAARVVKDQLLPKVGSDQRKYILFYLFLKWRFDRCISLSYLISVATVVPGAAGSLSTGVSVFIGGILEAYLKQGWWGGDQQQLLPEQQLQQCQQQQLAWTAGSLQPWLETLAEVSNCWAIFEEGEKKATFAQVVSKCCWSERPLHTYPTEVSKEW